ncbi:MAG: hypothetical protein QOH18_1041, partial [Solirubrobacterales bacterium]|nr:hypothetical protein [Solirubrobacterales bacterium]
HSFDLVEPAPEIMELANVTFHTGDSHALVPQVLGELAEKGENVDFVLVDGDHTPDGVEKDMHDLFASDAISRTVMLAHDTLNDEVREGLERIDYGAEPKVTWADLDFVGGHLSKDGPFKHQLWGGLGLFIVDADGSLNVNPGEATGFYDLFELIAPVRDSLAGAAAPAAPAEVPSGALLDDLRRRATAAEHELRSVRHSASWRVTAPLRAAKQAAKRRQER